MAFAKQSTAKSFLVGPILDADGVAKTNEVVGSIKVTKNGSVGAAHVSSTLTHDHTGNYIYAANAGDFDTLGEVEFSLNSGTNAMRNVVFQVVPADIYDSLISGSSFLPVDVRAFLATVVGESNTGDVAGAFEKMYDIQTPTGTVNSLPDAIPGAAGGLVTGDGTVTLTAGVGGRPAVDVEGMAGNTTSPAKLSLAADTMVIGTVDDTVAPSTTVFEAGDITEATANHYKGRVVLFGTGALTGQATAITAYELNGGRGKFTVDTMTEAPANTDTFIIV